MRPRGKDTLFDVLLDTALREQDASVVTETHLPRLCRPDVRVPLFWQGRLDSATLLSVLLGHLVLPGPLRGERLRLSRLLSSVANV
jgi:hypothetical protein